MAAAIRGGSGRTVGQANATPDRVGGAVRPCRENGVEERVGQGRDGGRSGALTSSSRNGRIDGVVPGGPGRSLESLSPQANMSDDALREVVLKIRMLAGKNFSGDYKRMFEYYATDPRFPGLVDRDALKNLLSDAWIGNQMTRGTYASGIIKTCDRNHDGRISHIEYRQFELSAH